MNPVSTSTIPSLVDRKVYIKGGKRKMMTDTGYMTVDAGHARRTFGKLQGGKYSKLQYDKR